MSIFKRAAALAAFLLTSYPVFAVNQSFSYPVPLTCTRNFYVRPAGTDTPGCGQANTDAAACKTIAGADGNITGLTGGDCVNVAPGTYNTGGHLVLNRSGSSNQANGYITYIGAPNLASKIFWNAPTFFGAQIVGNYVAMVGFEMDGNNLQGFVSYKPTNTNTYNAQNALFDSQGAGHHHIFLNNKMHGSGGAALGSTQDYEYAAGNEIYDMAGVNNCHTSAISVYQPVSMIAPSALPWDQNPFHFMYINNVIHDSGETAAETGSCPPQGTGHSDGNGLFFDSWGHQNDCSAPAYPYQGMMAGNVVYNTGGAGIYVLNSSNFCPTRTTAGPRAIFNNVAYNVGLDNNTSECVILFGAVSETWKNNLCFSTHGETSFVWTTAGWQDNGSGNPMAQNLTFNGTVGNANLNIDNAANLTYFNGSTTLKGVDPKLVNVTGFDFHPQSGSPVLGSGATISLPNVPAAWPTNLTPDGLIQPTPPNVGAFATAGLAPTGPISINSGGAAVGSFVADVGFNGGQTITNNPTCPVDVSLVSNPPPISIYRDERYGTFSYTIGNLTPLSNYKVNLHFTEDFDTAVGVRIMDVSINGANVLSSFDIFAATGAQNKAIVKSFTSNADINGNITISFAPHAGSTDTAAKVDAVEVLAIATVPSAGNFSYMAGFWYALDNPVPSFTAPTSHGANILRCAPAGMRNTATINNVATRVYKDDATGHVAFAIYSNGADNRPSALVASSNSMATTPQGSLISTNLGTNVQGGPGGTNVSDKFWVCSNSDSATASFVSVSANGGTTSTLVGGSTAQNILENTSAAVLLSHLSCAGAACTGGSSAFGAFPATLAGSTWTEQTTTNMPMMVVQFFSVP